MTSELLTNIDIKDLPEPCGYRILVKPVEPQTHRGSIALPDEVVESMRRSTRVGQVMKLGPDAFNKSDMGGGWYQVGDWVVFPMHGPLRIQVGAEHFIILNDDEVMAVVPNVELMKVNYL